MGNRIDRDYKFNENTLRNEWVGDIDNGLAKFNGTKEYYKLEVWKPYYARMTSFDMSLVNFNLLQTHMFVARTVTKEKKHVLPQSAALLIQFYFLKGESKQYNEVNRDTKVIGFVSRKDKIVGFRADDATDQIEKIEVFDMKDTSNNEHGYRLPKVYTLGAARPVMSLDGTWVVYVAKANKINVWNLSEDRLDESLDISTTKDIIALCISGNNKIVAAVTDHYMKNIMVWNTKIRGSHPTMVETHQRDKYAIVNANIHSSFDGSVIVVCWGIYAFSICRNVNGSGIYKEQGFYFHPYTTIKNIATLSPCGKMLAQVDNCSEKKDILHVISLESKKKIYSFEVVSPREIQFSPNGDKLMCHDSKKLHLFAIDKALIYYQ